MSDEQVQMAKEVVKEVVDEPIYQPRILATSTGTIVIHGHEYLPEVDYAIIETLMGMMESKNIIKNITFRDDDRPKNADDEPIFSCCVPDLGGVVVNLMHTFDVSLTTAEKEGVSVYAVFYREMLLNILHEYRHLECIKMKETLDEGAIEDWAEENLRKFGRQFRVELPHWKEHPFFGIMWEMVLEDSPKDKLLDQKRWVKEGILYELPGDNDDEPAKLVISDFRGYLHLWSKDDLDSPAWKGVQPSGLYQQMVKVDSAPVQEPVAQPTSTPPWNTDDSAVVPDAVITNNNTVHVSDDGIDYTGTQILVDDTYIDASMPNGAMTMAMTGPNGEVFTPEQIQAQAPSPTPVQQWQQPQAANQRPAPTGQNWTPPEPAGAGQTTAQAPIYPNHGLNDEQIGALAKGIYMKLYTHLYNECRRYINSDTAFEYPEGIHKPVPLTQEEAKIVMAMNYQDINGRFCKEASVQDWIAGRIYSKSKLPAYEIVLAGPCGERIARKLIPQNPAKMVNGQYSPNALRARAGDCIMYIFNMDVTTDGQGMCGKIDNGIYTSM